MTRKSVWFLIMTMLVLSTILLANRAVSLAAPGASPSYFPTPDNPKPPTPEPTSPAGGGGSSGGGGGGGSRFLDCNSSISGSVTDFGSMVPASGAVVEIGSSGWKSQTPADSNGHFTFNGLCRGAAYVKVLVPPGSLLTNPGAEVALDGKNHVLADLGFFLPLPQAVSAPGVQPASEPLVLSPGVQQSASTTPAQNSAGVSRPVPLSEGVGITVSAPRSVRRGLDAQVNVSIQNGGPAKVGGTVVRLPLASGLKLSEADTSRGSLQMQVVPQSPAKAGGLDAPSRAASSELVVNVGTLAPGDVVLIATKIAFPPDATSQASRAEIQAYAISGGNSYSSNVAVIAVEETGGPLIAVLPSSNNSGFAEARREFLW